ncbi:MAG: hypothetical protein E5W82_10225 [Mesorhizobium sp.]|nr:MAG: hypothetical protein E5W82_10225 [Mesorhizobium sp.]
MRAALKFDPLATAEDLTGTSSHNPDSPAAGLGLLLALANNHQREKLLLERDDTCFASMLDGYLRIIESNGYVRVLEDKFQANDFQGGEVEETFFIYAHPDGLLLKFDTHMVTRVNSASVYYNWKPATDDWYKFTSSGCMARGCDVWTGDHDAREALLFKMDELRANGEFVRPWAERPHLWLLHYMEPKVEGYDYRVITEARIARLPDWVRKFIGSAE